MNCEVCENSKTFYELSYKPTEKMKVFSSLSNLENKQQEKRHFCSNKCLKEWLDMPDNWK